MTIVSVQAGQSVLDSYVKTPRVGLSELIWNAFDADATHVKVTCSYNELGGITDIHVTDDGLGMTYDQAHRAFSQVGDSWKLTGRETDGGRPVHGRHGRGRYAAFSLGSSVQWSTTAKSIDGEKLNTIVVGQSSSLGKFTLSTTPADNLATGTEVHISGISGKANTDFDQANQLRNHLLTEFALVLERFKDFSISFLGSKIDSHSAEVNRTEISLSNDGAEGWDGQATLTVIEWNLDNVPRHIYLCDADNRVIDHIEPRIQAPGAEFTAYLTWQGFTPNTPILFEDDTSAPHSRLISAARDALRDHLANRQHIRELEVVERWQNEGVWPYDGEPSNEVEAATRDTFKVVALAASRTLDQSKGTKTKALSLRLLKETFEKDPEVLLPILADVASLPKSRIDELAHLLDHTTLTQLIQTGKEIGSRMEFLSGLRAILFEPTIKKHVLERRQLHRILVDETWIFGEEWSLTADDERLTTVLTKFLHFLGKDVELASGKEVLLEDGKHGIPDLVLGRKLKTSADTYEQLVVELKRPDHKVDDSDLSQLRKYASAITNDETFAQPNVKWSFWIVGNHTTTTVDEQRRQSGAQYGVVQDSEKYRIIVRPWAELISDAEHRLKFVQKSLDYTTTKDSGLAYLRDKYAEYLPRAAHPNPK